MQTCFMHPRVEKCLLDFLENYLYPHPTLMGEAKSKKSWIFRALLIIVFITSTFLVASMKKDKPTQQSSNNHQVQGSSQDNLAAESEALEDEIKDSEVLSQENRTNTNNQFNFGVVLRDYENKTGALTSLEQRLNYQFTTVAVYIQFGNEFNNRLASKSLDHIKAQNKHLLVSWEPWNPNEGLNQSRDYLVEINNGQQDNYIKTLASDVKNYAGPVTIRFGHEMNGNWYPWGLRPDEYIKAYRRVVDIFRQEGVENAKWMWSINADSVPYEPISRVSKYYPGNNYVDEIGIDGYNFGSTQPGSRWQSFDNIFSSSYNYLQSYNKPIVISEVASSEEGGNKAEWIRGMFNSLSSGYPRVTEVVWFNLLKEADWRIESTDSSLEAIKSGLESL